MRAIKGFDANMKCRGFQFKEGETYTATGPIAACKNGFHAIPEDEHPLAVLGYYAPAGSVFRAVEIDGATDRDGDKVSGEILKVGPQIDLATEAVAWVMARAKGKSKSSIKDNSFATASGDQGAATASGYQGAATASGARGAATASGTQGAATASGHHSNAHACGYFGMVRGAIGCGLYAVERATWDGPILSNACGIVGQNGIKPDTWYRCEGGDLVEAA